MKAPVQLAVWVVVGMGVLALLLYRGVVRCNYPDLQTYPLQGVDVSHHQGEIEWRRLQGPAVQFAYIKASEGATLRDPRFASNWQSALAAGITPGAYHFFTLCKPGAEQAQNFPSGSRDCRKERTGCFGSIQIAGACPESVRSST